MAKKETASKYLTLPAAEAAAEKPAALPGVKFKVKKNLVLPPLKTSVGVPVFVRITDEIKRGKLLPQDIAAGKTADEAAEIITVINLATGEEQQIIGGMVLCNTLHEAYPNHEYIGKNFALTKGEQKGSGTNKYHPWAIQEIELENE